MDEIELDQEPTVLPYVPFPTFLDWVPETFEHRVFDRFAEQLAKAKADAGADALSAAVNIATKWAAVNTGAIEGLYDVDRGFTYSVALSGAAWSNVHKLKGDSAAHAMEDAIAAYDYVLDATTKQRPVTEFWIKELHSIVCKTQESFTVITAVGPQDRNLPLGTYKSDPNSPLNLASNQIHSYAPPMDTGPEMARLITELGSDQFTAAHPVLQAAYSHYAFVCVHPFADGNGRVSRALASAYLYRDPGVPLVIFADQKGEYLDALEAADAGDHSKFIRFVSERAIDTVEMVKSQMDTATVPEASEQLSIMARGLTGVGGLQHAEIDAIAERALAVFADALETQIGLHPVPHPMTSKVTRTMSSGMQLPAGYRQVPNNPTFLMLRVSSPAPAAATLGRQFTCVIAKSGTDDADFLIVGESRTVLEISLREMHPTVGAALSYRAQNSAYKELTECVLTTAHLATTALQEQGYV